MKTNKHTVLACTLTTLAVITAGMCASGTCYADDFYVTLGAGTSKLNHNGQDNWWYQNRFPYEQKEDSQTYNVGLGYRVASWLNVELGHTYLGRYRLKSEFVSPDEMYKPDSPTGCDGTCPARVKSWGEGSARAWSLTALPEFGNKDYGIFARLGASYVNAKYKHFMLEPPIYDQIKTALEDEGGTSAKRVSAVLGGGLRFKDVTLEYVNYPHARGKLSAYNSVQTVTLNYRYGF